MNRRLRVLHFVNSVQRGGVEAHVLGLLRAMDRKLFRPYLACTPELLEVLLPEVPVDVITLPVLLRSPRHLAGMHRLAHFLREHRIDILHSHLFFSSLFASPLSKLCGVRATVETPHLRESWRHGLKATYIVDRLAGCFVDRYIAVSQANADYLCGTKGIPARKVEVIRNGCDLPQPSNAASLREEVCIAPGMPLLLVVGRLEPQKGHRVLLNALPQILAAEPRTRVVFAGEGALRPSLERMSCALGLENVVSFLGYRNDAARWMAAADLTVLPSLFEGLPLVAIESLAIGTPVVASAVDGTPEVVLDGTTGLTFPAGDSNALAAAVVRLLSSPELRARMAKAGRAHVLQNFTHDRQVRETEALYLAVARLLVAAPAEAAVARRKEAAS